MNSQYKYYIIGFCIIICTVFFASYIAEILFTGNNSLETYESLKTKKVQLEQEIKRLQNENANLQKKFIDLKNLEPEHD